MIKCIFAGRPRVGQPPLLANGGPVDGANFTGLQLPPLHFPCGSYRGRQSRPQGEQSVVKSRLYVTRIVSNKKSYLQVLLYRYYFKIFVTKY